MAVSITRTADPAGVSASGNVATYSGASIGTASNDRIVCVVVTSELASSTPSACTIGGVTANAGTTGNFGAVYARIFWLPVSSGTTADIAVTYSATNPTNVQNHISVYAITGAAVLSTGGNGSTDMDATARLTTGSITIPTDGGFLAVAGGAADTVAKTWANATEDLDVDAGGFRHTTATRTTSGTVTVTCTGGTNGEDGAMSWMIFAPGTVLVKSESVTVTESVTVFKDSENVIETESVTVTENVQRQVENRIEVTDTATVSESVKLEVNSSINKSDSITVSESTKLNYGKLDTLSDNFNDNSIDTAKWDVTDTANTSVSESGGQLVITSVVTSTDTGYIESDVAYDLTGSHGYVQLYSFTGGNTGTLAGFVLSTSKGLVDTGTAEGLYFYVIDGTLYASWNEGASEHPLANAVYSSTDHKWLRIRELSGTIYWEVASDAQLATENWQAFASVATPITITALYPSLQLAEYDGATGATVKYDNFNIIERYVTASDTTTITENTGRLLESYVNKSDTATITESINTLLESYINKSDSTTVTDTPTVTIQTDVFDVNVSVSDNVTVTENLQREVENRTSVSDTSTITENVQIYQENYAINKSDTIAITENVVNLLTSGIATSDPITVAENVGRLLESNIRLEDNGIRDEGGELLLDENGQVMTDEGLGGDFIVISESVSLSIVTPEPGISVSDTITVTESVSVSVEGAATNSTSNLLLLGVG